MQVEGPEFSGKVSVEVGPCTVTIPFGSQRDKPTPVLAWPAFVTKYLEEAAPGRARAITAITGRGSLPPATGGSTSTPTPDGTPEHPFEVYAEFEITVTTTVPDGRLRHRRAGRRHGAGASGPTARRPPSASSR